MAHFLPVTGEDAEVTPADGQQFTVPELEFFVGGNFNMFALTDGRVMVLNVEGKQLRLATNPRATALLQDRLAPNDTIVGDVIICTLMDVGALGATR